MAKNAAFPTGQHVSLNVGTGVTSGSPLRIGRINCVAETDSGDMTSTVNVSTQNGTTFGITVPSGGVGNKSGWASVSLAGAWNLSVTGGTTCAVGAPIYWVGGAKPLTTVGTQALATPTFTAATATTGGTLAAATYYYRVTAVNAIGETLSNEVSQATTGTTSTVTLTITAVSGATSYNVYRSTASGAEIYLGNTTGTSYVDNGSVTPSGNTFPIANTSGSPVWGLAQAAKTVTADANVFVLVVNAGL